ncbi:PREDICTED: uncharacterized protein LOC108565477 isoform X2 [Nicrophorus vespilloides]|uniref:Uncharacterized protein LOC108565477 isoform X2 n=1 Tax=Nicrophorus vespilloides TaxID=110193 RepID=A0ABM1N0W8_NICVS|nr:PREDICTED: uncharacterized protein LOC108565477 isoform X2 [Nicrophorus vespilloides]
MPGQYSPKCIPLQDLKSSTTHMSPLSVRASSRTQDSSFIQDPDESVVKISSMFPTVSETHIRLLLKKYHNREAVVISALQVEKHPIATPGPFATPPPTRSANAPLYMSTPPLGLRSYSRTSSPILKTCSSIANNSVCEAYRNSPRPHSSPKLKLRYMKSIFPKAEETVILDVLANNENNIQKTSECLKGMGFVKKDPAKLKQELEDKAKEREEQQQIAKADSPPPMPKIKTQQEKDSVKLNLLDSYSDIPEHVIGMALDSVHFDEDRAKQILDIMVQEDNKIKENNRKDQVEDEVIEVTFLTVVNNVASSQSRQSLKSLLKEKQDNSKTIYNRVIEENSMNNSEYKSSNLSSTNGCNPDFANGANQKLLLEDYVNWQGPNPKLSNGPNRSLLLPRREAYKASGANPDLCKGPVFGLAKGSIFSQLKSMAIGESRGK